MDRPPPQQNPSPATEAVHAPVERRTFAWNDLTAEFIRFGKGPNIALCFPGHGRGGEDFLVFEPAFGTIFTFYAVNLFHHGGSTFPSHRVTDAPLEKDEMSAFFQALLDEEGIRTATLMGYSLGGKIALSLLESLPDRFPNAYFFATDGLKTSIFYTFASRTRLGRSLYRLFIDHPGPLIGTIHFLRAIGILSEKMRKFLLFHLESRKERQFVYDVWSTFRNIRPDLASIRHSMDHYGLELHFFFGRYDPVIKPHLAKRLLSESEYQKQVHVLQAGHELLDERAVKALKGVVTGSR